jgi:TonB family protein
MFAAISPMDPNSRRFAPHVSVIVHCAFLAWLLHSPRPIFVAPSSVARGDGGTRVTRLHWPGRPLDSGPGDPSLSAPVSLQHKDARARLEWAQPPKAGKGRKVPPANVAHDQTAKENTTGTSAGSIYGSMAQGPLSGEDVRPALPVRGSDPQVYPWELREEGDVVVEVTIDEAGNIIDKRVLHSMTPAIDQKVLLALESWHFHPATRDGVPIPSKQDVHYHFKPS